MAWREDATITKLRLGDPALVQNVQTEVIDGATTLTAADNGKTLVLAAAGGAAVTLPAPVNGMRFRFVTGLAFATTNWVVGTNGAAAIIHGPLTVAGLIVAGSSEKQINFVATAESLGDWVMVESDGTSWFLSGVAEKSGGITVTAP